MKQSVQSRLIPWLLMPWLLKQPGHQQPWYWISRINRSLSSTGKDFNYLCHISIVKLQKMELYCFLNKICLQNGIHLDSASRVSQWNYMFSYLQEIYPPLFCRLHLYGELAGVLFSGGMVPIHINCLTVSLRSPNTANRAVKGECQWPLKNHGNSHQLHEFKYTTIQAIPT